MPPGVNSCNLQAAVTQRKDGTVARCDKFAAVMVVSACPFCNKSVFTRALSHETGNRKRYRPRPAFVALPKSDRQNTKGSRHTGDHSPCVQSANFDADRDNTAEGAQQPLRGPEEASTPAWDVVGLGQPMVDFSASVEDDLLVRLGIVKGSRR